MSLLRRTIAYGYHDGIPHADPDALSAGAGAQRVMPGIYTPPTATDFPFGTVLLPAPPHPVEPLPDATHEPPPYSGWYSFESDHPLVQYSTPWQARQVVEASRGQYHRSENVQSYVTFLLKAKAYAFVTSPHRTWAYSM